MIVTIDLGVPFDDYSTPGKVVPWVDVFYHTDAGYKGKLRIPRAEFDPKTIHAKCADDARAINNTIGTTVEVK